MKKLLLTGFEPFMNYTVNPTEDIVKSLDQRVVGDYLVYGRLLPVDYDLAAKRLREVYEDVSPDDVLLLGLAAGRNCITPERVGINCKGGVVDNNGVNYEDEPIVKEGPDAYFSKLPIRAFVNELKTAGYPAEISNTAGTYLCNLVMYSMLHMVSETDTHVRAGFVHMPASHELAVTNPKLPSWSQKDLVEAVEIMIRTL